MCSLRKGGFTHTLQFVIERPFVSRSFSQEAGPSEIYGQISLLLYYFCAECTLYSPRNASFVFRNNRAKISHKDLFIFFYVR
jgi:hypothetical protein